MNKLSNLAILLLSCILFLGCESRNAPNLGSEMLIGIWANPSWGDTVTYKRIGKLPDSNFGFEFKANGVFIERKNSGWCATPPIFFSDYEGKWSKNDSIVKITVGYWGGIMEYEWKVISVDKKHLKIIILKHEAHENIK